MGSRDRRRFLTAVASGSVGLTLLAAAARAQSNAPASAPPGAPASPAVEAGVKPPSAIALATAAGMRAFDAALTDDQLHTIAAGIDATRELGAPLNPKKKRLSNADGPVTTFNATFFLA